MPHQAAIHGLFVFPSRLVRRTQHVGSLPSLLPRNDFLTLFPHLSVLGTGEPSGHLASRTISDRDFVFSPSDILLYLVTGHALPHCSLFLVLCGFRVMDLPFMSFSEACVVERFTKVPLSVTSHFAFIFFQWKFMFRLEFCNNFFFLLLYRSN